MDSLEVLVDDELVGGPRPRGICIYLVYTDTRHQVHQVNIKKQVENSRMQVGTVLCVL